MYVTKKGLFEARQRLAEMQQRVNSAQGETAEMYNNSGDTWHDNPGWYAAQQQQRVAERHLSTLVKLLRHNHTFIEDLEIDCNRVMIGCVVGVEDEFGRREITILGPFESNPEHDVVSYESPIAKAMESMHIGDLINLSEGYECKIVSIRRWCPPQPQNCIQEP